MEFLSFLINCYAFTFGILLLYFCFNCLGPAGVSGPAPGESQSEHLLYFTLL